MPEIAIWILAGAAGYLAGAIPFGLVLTRMAGLGDIRKMGSGNIGATNVLRTGNKPLAAATLLLDAGKGAAAALAVQALIDWRAAVIAGTLAVIGHNYPVWLRFKGGKGVATSLGTILALAPPVGAACCATWLLVAGLFRYSSLAALVSLGLAPVYVWWVVPEPGLLPLATSVLAVLAVIRHADNIDRLREGREPKIGRKG